VTDWRKTTFDQRIEVSSCGLVRKKINDNHPERRQYFTYRTYEDKDGYKCLRIANKKWIVHRLVYETWCGPLVSGLVVCHLDGDCKNNHWRNLKQASQRENISHKNIHGTAQRGEKHPRSIMTDEQAAHLRRFYERLPRSASGRIRRGAAVALAKQENVSARVIYDLGRTWLHV
jgi:hypothetical protein